MSLINRNQNYLYYIIGALCLLVLFTTFKGNDTNVQKIPHRYNVELPSHSSSFSSPSSEHVFSEAKSDAPGAGWEFSSYEPSKWEQWWFDNIASIESNTERKVCPYFAQSPHLENSVDVVTAIKQLRTSGSSVWPKYENTKYFSKMHYTHKSAETGETYHAVQLIEPLAGLLRDYFATCTCPIVHHPYVPLEFYEGPGENIQSKKFLLISAHAPVYVEGQHSLPAGVPPFFYRHGASLSNPRFNEDAPKHILVDLGASLWSSWVSNPDAIGHKFFYDEFKSRNIEWDKIICMEFNKQAPTDVWNDIPDDVVSKYTYINVGCDSKGKFNPWNILRNIARPQDFVLVKLDIDTPQIENPLMIELLGDPQLQGLIDEMFFEHHVDLEECRFWGPGVAGKLKDTYNMFTALRKAGIRMHSWP